MLMFSRKVGQGVVFVLPSGEEIRVVVTLKGAGTLKLGIDAPRDVRIWRDEIYAKILGKK